jgi:hypothetical protein
MQIKALPTPENISDIRLLKPGLLQKISLPYADQSLVYSRKHLCCTQIKAWSTSENISAVRR